MTEEKKVLRPLVDELAMQAFGRTRTEADTKDVCVSCGERAGTFKNEVSRKEWEITRFCQKCQDDMFGGEEDPEIALFRRQECK
jgi:hypothetical protein